MFGHEDHDENNTNDAQQHVDPAPNGSLTQDGDQPGAPTTDSPTPDTDAGNFMTDDTPVVSSDNQPPAPAAASVTVVPTQPHDQDNGPDDDLLSIKQQALQQLSPLVGHLDQTPEEKFRTTMMMIQASDNKALIKDAFAAAQGIADEKVRAQAFLDVVNEINYFTQQNAE